MDFNNQLTNLFKAHTYNLNFCKTICKLAKAMYLYDMCDQKDILGQVLC